MALKLMAERFESTIQSPKEHTHQPPAYTWENRLSMSYYDFNSNFPLIETFPQSVLHAIEEEGEEEAVTEAVAVVTSAAAAAAADTRHTKGLRRHTMLVKDGVVIRDLDLIPRVSIRTIINVTINSTLNTITKKHVCNSIIL